MENKKIKISTIIYTALFVIIAYFITIGILIYGFGTNNLIIQKTTSIIPYPAAFIGKTGIIKVIDLEKDLKSVKMFYENQDFSDTGLRVDFTTEDGRKRLLIKKKDLLNKLIENKIIQYFANQKGINITSEDVSQEVNRKLAEYGSQDEVVKTLQNLYGWNMEDFKQKIVKPDMYKKALWDKVGKEDSIYQESNKKIGKAANDLKNKKDFERVVQEYSEGESAKNGGEVGWFNADQMLPEIAQVAFKMKVGETSDVIESFLGFHIIRLEGKKVEDGVEKVKIKQIIVRIKSFSDWLLEQEKNVKIFVLLKDFYWDTANGEIKFKDNEMQKFEDNLLQNSSGDASVMF